MESISCLGMTMTSDALTAVLLIPQSGGRLRVGSVLRIENPSDSEETPLPLPEQLYRQIQQKSVRYEQMCVARHAGEYTQHQLHSEFTEFRQINQTIRFDTEEAVATDVSDLAIAFHMTSVGETGSDVAVFTTSRSRISLDLNELLSRKFDPAMIEPDLVSLARYLDHGFEMNKHPNRLYAVLSDGVCYLICSGQDSYAPRLRSFLIRRGAGAEKIFKREIRMTLAALGDREPIEEIHLSGDIEGLEMQSLSEQIGLKVSSFSLLDTEHIQIDDPVKTNPVSFAVAAGSALGEIYGDYRTDFRADFSPYLGKRKIMQKLGLVISASVTLALVAMAVFFQFQAFRDRRDANRLQNHLEQQYKKIMGTSYTTREPMDRKLSREVNKLQKANRGLFAGDDESVPAKVTYVLEAINELPASVDLNIDEISLSAGNISVRGDTASSAQTRMLFSQLDKHPRLERINEILKEAGTRHSFSVNLSLDGE